MIDHLGFHGWIEWNVIYLRLDCYKWNFKVSEYKDFNYIYFLDFSHLQWLMRDMSVTKSVISWPWHKSVIPDMMFPNDLLEFLYFLFSLYMFWYKFVFGGKHTFLYIAFLTFDENNLFYTKWVSIQTKVWNFNL